MAVLRMTDLDLKGKRVLIRSDMNVPLKDGVITNDKRIQATLPTIRAAAEAGAKVLVMTHLGPPTEGEFDPALSLAPIAQALTRELGQEVTAHMDWLDGVPLEEGQVALSENVRFLSGEKKNDEALGKAMAALCDIYVNDAFGTAHRAQSSTHAVARFAPVACAGPLLAGELENLGKALDNPARPIVGIVGGSKVSTKLTVLDSLSKKVDKLIIGGGIANTFLAATGKPVGKSLYEPDLMGEATSLMEAAKAAGGEIPVPVDVIVAKELSEAGVAVMKQADDVADDDMILDVGPETAKMYAAMVKDAGTVVWNGPLGAFEYDQFAGGTIVLANAVAASDCFSIAGGGDTVAAVEKYGVADKLSYISTGGGSFLEFLEGKELPAVAILEERAK